MGAGTACQRRRSAGRVSETDRRAWCTERPPLAGAAGADL